MSIIPFIIVISLVLVTKLHGSSVNEVTSDPSYRYRMSSDNRTRLIATIFDEPLMMLKKDQNGNLTEHSIPSGTVLDPSQVEGYYVDLTYAIYEEKLKIPYKFIIETKYGMQIKKGVWDGLVGALVNRVADAAIASLTITATRGKAVDFSHPFIHSGISLMMRKPQKQKLSVFSVMGLLEKEVWICIIISYFFVHVISFFVYRLSSYKSYLKDENDMIQRKKLSNYSICCFWFAGFMHHGASRSISGRIVTGVWWFFIFILLSWYIAHLAAFPVAPRLITPIETFEDLVKQTEIRYGVMYGGSTMAFFNNSKQKIIKNMWQFMQRHKDEAFVSSTQDGIELVRRSKGRFAFFLDSLSNEYVNERVPCDTMRVGEIIVTKGYGIATPHGSDLRQAMNIAVLELFDTGFLDQLKQKWFHERSDCETTAKSNSKGITQLKLADVAGIFYILIIGVGLAVIIAFFEFLIKAKLDSSRLSQRMGQVLRRNLRVSIMGIDSNEKEEAHQMSIEQPHADP